MSKPPANSGWLCLLQPSRTLQCCVLGAGRLCCGAAGLCGVYYAGLQLSGCWLLDRQTVAPLAVAEAAWGMLVWLAGSRLQGAAFKQVA